MVLSVSFFISRSSLPPRPSLSFSFLLGFFLFLLLFPDGLQFFFYLFCGEVDASNGSAVVHQYVTRQGSDVEATEKVEKLQA